MRGASGFYGRNRALVWICALIAVNQLGFGAIVPVLPLYARNYGVSEAAIGLAIAVYGLARFLVNVPSGRFADRVGRRGALALGGAITVVGQILCALAPTYLPFLGARFIAGAGAAFVLTASQVVLADISTPERRGRIMGTYQGVFAFAVGAGPYPGGLLAEHFGLEAPFYACAITSAIVAVLAWSRVPETRNLRPAGAPAAGRPVTIGFTEQMRLLTAQLGFLLISAVSFSTFAARTGALFNIIPIMGKVRLGLAPDRIGFGLGLISILGLLLAYPSGAMVDRFGRKAVIVPATLLTGASLVVFAWAPTYGWFLAACGVWAVASGLSSAAPAAYAADMAPPGMNAAAMSTYRMLSDSGYVLGPLLIGVAADTISADAALGATAALVVAMALLFARFAPETRRRAARAAVIPPPPAMPEVVAARPAPNGDE